MPITGVCMVYTGLAIVACVLTKSLSSSHPPPPPSVAVWLWLGSMGSREGYWGGWGDPETE